MGCCGSKSKTKEIYSPEKSPVPGSDPPLPEVSHTARPPPPPPPLLPHVEEETVKEVLLETSNSKPSFPKLYIRDESEAEKAADQKPPPPVPIYAKKGVDSAASDLSEIGSLSESISAATMRGEEDDDDGEVGMRFKEISSPARYQQRRRQVTHRRDFVAGRSPSRRSEFSPARRTPAQLNRPWIPAGSNGLRRDLVGENSGRKSPSPARRLDGSAARSDLGRTASGRKTGRSPRRDFPPAAAAAEGGSELLENPLVSLECFIFL